MAAMRRKERKGPGMVTVAVDGPEASLEHCTAFDVPDGLS
jgi:hypothetical protein